MGLSELMKMLSEQNIRENHASPTIWSNPKDEIDYEYLQRQIARRKSGEDGDLGKHYKYSDNNYSDLYLDPSEDIQPQHMVQPKQDMWLSMLKQGRN